MNNTSNKRRIKGVEISISQYARDNGISWITAKNRLLCIPRKKRMSNTKNVLEDFASTIFDKVSKYDCSAVSIFNFIKNIGYNGSLSSVTKHVQQLKGTLLNKATIRVESTAGLQGQVDWKESMILLSKTKEVFKFNIFLYILSFSKKKYIELTIDRTQDTLFRCLVNAFKYCGSRIPHEIWFDNMKTVVDYHDINTNEIKFNSRFEEFAKNCQFTPIACRPYRPCTKGIVENLAKVMDRLKVINEEFDSFDDLNNIIKEFNISLNNEISQSTGKKPNELFLIEKEYLSPINLDQFKLDSVKIIRMVSKESMVNYNKRKYSVPTSYIGSLVELEELDNYLYIYYSGKKISSHIISDKKYNYRKEDLVQILPSVYKSLSTDQINEMAERRLNGFDCLKRGDDNELR